MKKTYRQMSAIVIALLTLALTVSCQSRRDEIKENQTSETETVTESREEQNFYANMLPEDFVSLYIDNETKQKSYSEAINTPYYYIFPDSEIPGGQIFNKLTNSFEYMCKDAFCNHETCIFSGMEKHICEGYFICGDRIYMLILSSDVEIKQVFRYCLYSVDLLFEDLRLDFEFPETVENIVEGGHKPVEFMRRVDQCVFYNDVMYCSDYYIDSDGFVSPTLYKLDLNTKEYGIFLDDTYVKSQSLQLFDHALSWANLDNERVYYDLRTGEFTEDTNGAYEEQPFNIEFSEEYSILKRALGDNFGFVAIDHTTEMFADDPHYEYYKCQYRKKMDKAVRCGGEIYRVERQANGEAQLVPFVKLETDGIPDVICWFSTDGKTILVKYETYKDFSNPYHTLMGNTELLSLQLETIYTGGSNARYAIIDIETGKIIKGIQSNGSVAE